MLVGSMCLVAAACSGAKECTLIGADSGVVVNFDRGVLPATGPILLHACVNGACNSQEYKTRPRHVARLSVPVSPVPSDSDVQVTLRITSTSRTVFAGSTRAHSTKHQPNGPGCDPIVWGVGVVAHSDGSLTSVS